MANVSVNANKQVEIKLTIQSEKMDFSKCKSLSEGWMYDVVGSWSHIIIEALEMRRTACLHQLLDHKDDVIGVTSEAVYYQTKCRVKAFSIQSDQAMEDGIKALKQSDWSCVKAPLINDQIRKALYWLPEEDRQDIDPFSFGDLLSALDLGYSMYHDR